MKKTVALLIILAVAILFVACGTNDNVIVCEHCGFENTIGSKFCSGCGKQTSDLNDNNAENCVHIWKDATCTTPKTCSKCDTTLGDKLGHQNGDWSEWELDYKKAVNTREMLCLRCEEVINSESKKITTFVDEASLIISPSAFSILLESAFDNFDGYAFEAEMEYDKNKNFYAEDNTVFYRLMDGKRSVGLYDFTNSNGKSMAVRDIGTKNAISIINILIDETDDVSPIVFASIFALNPNLSNDEVSELGNTIFESVDNMNGVTSNNLNYTLYKSNGYHYLIITVVD